MGGNRAFRLGAACALIGVFVGVLSGVSELFLRFVERMALGTSLSDVFSVSPLRRMIALVICACIVGPLWYILRTRGKRIVPIREAIAEENMPIIETLANASLQIASVGMGMSVGREGAPREVGALIGQLFSRFLSMKDSERALLVSAAAGAGLAGVYDAPFAGAFFSAELLLRSFSVLTIGCSLLCSCVASWVAGFIIGGHHLYSLGSLPVSLDSHSLMACLLLGAIVGIVGELLYRFSKGAADRMPRGSSVMPSILLIALVTGTLAWIFPELLGNGQLIARISLSGELTDYSWVHFAFFGCVKFALTVLTIAAGVAGGILTPSIAVGSSIGMAFALVFGLGDPALFALVGAAALLSASQHAPMMALFLVAQLSHAPWEAMMPLALTCGCAVLTGQLSGGLFDRAVELISSFSISGDTHV